MSKDVLKKNQSSTNEIVFDTASFYKKRIQDQMKAAFGYENILAIPKIEKIVLSIGMSPDGDFKAAIEDLSIIAGQSPVITKCKTSVSQFGTRVGMNNGLKVTLRGKRMYNFISRLIVALLSWRDFQGINQSSVNKIGKKCQISFGIHDKRIFHGVSTAGSMKQSGLNCTIVTNCKSIESIVVLLKSIYIPFKKD